LSAVFDSSAVLAIINDEPGGSLARERLPGASMSLVNAIEVASKLTDKGMPLDRAWRTLDLLDLTLVELDPEIAVGAVALRSSARHRTLSLADRVCLALATRNGVPALTADRVWAELDLPCKIELIR
jgi:ribonuclease VapC